MPPGTWDGDPNAPWNAPEIVGVCHNCGEEIPIEDEQECRFRAWWEGGDDRVICPRCVDLEIDICEKCGETIELEVSKTCTACDAMPDEVFKALVEKIETTSAELDALQAEHRKQTGRNHRWFK